MGLEGGGWWMERHGCGITDAKINEYDEDVKKWIAEILYLNLATMTQTANFELQYGDGNDDFR